MRPLIYVVAAPEVSPGRVKIGFTAGTTTARLRDLQTGSPVKLEVLYETEGNMSTERILHTLFAPRRIHGEWFDFGDLDPVTEVSGAVQLLRDAVEPYDPNRMTKPDPRVINDGRTVSYEERRDAIITALILHGRMSLRKLAPLADMSVRTLRRIGDRMVAEGVVTPFAPGRADQGVFMTLIPEHPAVASLLRLRNATHH